MTFGQRASVVVSLGAGWLAGMSGACSAAHGTGASAGADASSLAPATPEADCEGIVGNPEFDETRRPLPLAPHRERPSQCDTSRPCNYINTQSPLGVVCRSHVECAEGANGRCQAYGYECSYDACFSDGDCGESQLCDCTGGQSGSHVCIEAHCRVDADCPDGLWCSPTRPVSCYNLSRVSSYRCHTHEDECLTDADCPAACVFDPERAHWRCVGGNEQCTVP